MGSSPSKYPYPCYGGDSATQPSVFSLGKQHALFLWIHLKPDADKKACAKATAKLQSYVEMVEKMSPSGGGENEVLAGVGYGSEFYTEVGGTTNEDYKFEERSGPLGGFPSTGGDIFIHAKSNNESKVFQLCQVVMAQLPEGAVDKFEDTYGFVYKDSRDLSGFIDGTENPDKIAERKAIAVEQKTGGSYAVTQKWVHKLDVIAETELPILEAWVGRTREDSVEMRDKPETAHIARVTGGNDFEQKKEFEIVRQSMPYGNLHEQAGLFFIAYYKKPEAFNFMLDRMVGGEDNIPDRIMLMTQCITSTYFYFPGNEELRKLNST